MATKIFSTKKNGQSKTTSKSYLKKTIIGVLAIALIAGGTYGGYQYVTNDGFKNSTASRPVRPEPSKTTSNSFFNLSNDQKSEPRMLSSNSKKPSKKMSGKKKSKKTVKHSKKKHSKKFAKNSHKKGKKSHNKKLAKHKKKNGRHLAKYSKGKKAKKTNASKKRQKSTKKNISTASR